MSVVAAAAIVAAFLLPADWWTPLLWVGAALCVVVAAAWLALVPQLSYLAYRWEVTDIAVHVRYGKLSHTDEIVPLSRVQIVDSTQSPLMRFFGLRTVTVQMVVGTGAGQGELTIDSVAVADAERLRLLLLRCADASSAPPDEVPVAGSSATATGPSVSAPGEIARLSWSWLRFAPLTINNLHLVDVAIGALVLYFPISAEAFVRHTLTDLFGVGGVALGLLLVWILGTCVGFAALTVVREPGDAGPILRSEHGVLPRQVTTLEEAKIRGVTIGRPTLVGLAGGVELQVLTTVLHEDKTQLLPSSPRALAEAVAVDVLNEVAAVTAPVVAHESQARNRQYVRHSLTVLLIVVTIVVEEWLLTRIGFSFLPGGAAVKIAAVVIAVPGGLLTAELRYRRLGHGLTRRYLVSCTGTITTVRTALQTEGIVGWRIHQSFWDRRRGLARLSATTAAGEGEVVVPDIPIGDAVALAAAATPRTVEGFLSLSLGQA